MLCRFVFGFWWSIFVSGIWWHLRQPLHVWKVDRHKTKRIDTTITIKPIEFVNASVLWIDMLSDSVHLNLNRTYDTDIMDINISNAKMQVFETSFRDTMMEVYDIGLPSSDIEKLHIDLVQDDVHLSPFRRIVIEPAVNWYLGSDEDVDLYRAGHFKDGKWYEGRDSTQLGFGALFAWCMGVMFLVVMRRKTGTVVVKRKKRVFK